MIDGPHGRALSENRSTSFARDVCPNYKRFMDDLVLIEILLNCYWP